MPHLIAALQPMCAAMHSGTGRGWHGHLVAGRACETDSGHSWHKPRDNKATWARRLQHAAYIQQRHVCAEHTQTYCLGSSQRLPHTACNRRGSAAPSRREAAASALLALTAKVPFSSCSAGRCGPPGVKVASIGCTRIWSHAEAGGCKISCPSWQRLRWHAFTAHRHSLAVVLLQFAPLAYGTALAQTAHLGST